MPQYVFAYHGGTPPSSPEDGQKMMKAWREWMESLGEAMVNRGEAVGKSKTVDQDGVHDNGGANPIMGFSIVEAENMDAAAKMAAISPHITLSKGSIEIAQVMDMEM